MSGEWLFVAGYALLLAVTVPAAVWLATKWYGR